MTFHYRLVAICIDKLSTIDNHGWLHNFKRTGINSNSKHITEAIHNINIPYKMKIWREINLAN